MVHKKIIKMLLHVFFLKQLPLFVIPDSDLCPNITLKLYVSKLKREQISSGKNQNKVESTILMIPGVGRTELERKYQRDS